MLEHSTRIEAVVALEGRGCVIVPGIPRAADSHVKLGDHVYILGDRGRCIDTIIRGIEMISARPRISGFPILLPKTIAANEIPIGSSLHIVEGSPQDGNPGAAVLAIGDQVRVRMNARNTTEHTGVVARKTWHYKYQLWYYFIRSAAGRRISKRYTAADLVRTAVSSDSADARQPK